ncbi:MAG TPA: hypothetical protein VF552_11825 [Allosphingosinicella sp.]|jgi:hypothetical protein
MSDFEFVFSLFGLLLGLGLAAGLGGLARALKSRHRVRIGWSTSLLALLLSCDLVTFWGYAWSIRAHVPATFPVLFFGFVVTAIYYVAASLAFPDDPDEWEDLEGHFARHRRTVLAGMFVANAMLIGAAIALTGFGPGWLSLRTILITWSFFPLTAAAIVADDRRIVLGAIVLLIALYPLAVVWRV